jgi:RNA polymerase subunit RPABC4/transcription elongation factor Spt4
VSVKCSDCDYELAENQSPCPNCGGTKRTINFEVPTMTVKVTASAVQMTLQRIEVEIKRNWPLIAVLSIGDLISTIPAYFLSGWASVTVTLAFIVFSTIVGYYAITRVITVTRETR